MLTEEILIILVPLSILFTYFVLDSIDPHKKIFEL